MLKEDRKDLRPSHLTQQHKHDTFLQTSLQALSWNESISIRISSPSINECPIVDHHNGVIMNAMTSQITCTGHDGLLNRLFRRRSKKTSKLRATGLCEGNSQVTCEFPSQMASNAENVSIRWRHHDISREGGIIVISCPIVHCGIHMQISF